jgi:hypothetical protein
MAIIVIVSVKLPKLSISTFLFSGNLKTRPLARSTVAVSNKAPLMKQTSAAVYFGCPSDNYQGLKKKRILTFMGNRFSLTLEKETLKAGLRC